MITRTDPVIWGREPAEGRQAAQHMLGYHRVHIRIL